MGILDSARQAAQQATGWNQPQQPQQPQQSQQPVPTAARPSPEYDAEVNRDKISIRWLPRHMNKRAQDGWRLHSIFEQDGNTVMIWERWR